MPHRSFRCQQGGEKARDTFVLLCNLGQRYSDIVRISPENFERYMFRIIQQKTGNKAIADIDRFFPIYID